MKQKFAVIIIALFTTFIFTIQQNSFVNINHEKTKFDLNVKSLSYNVLQRTEFNIVSTIENSLHNIILTVRE